MKQALRDEACVALKTWIAWENRIRNRNGLEERHVKSAAFVCHCTLSRMELFMRHLGIALRVVLLGFALLKSAPAFAQADKTSPANPHLVSEFPCPDPHVFNDGSDWYIFGTGAQPFFLQGKEFGEGKMKKVFLDLDYSGYPLNVAHIWGFIVHRHSDGSYHAYGTLHLGNFHTVIAYFEPQASEKWEKGKPITKWKFKSVVVGDPARQDWKYYESKILEDTDKSIYLMYVANTGRDNFIFAQKMKSWSEIDTSAPRRLILKPEGYRSEDRNGPGSMQLVEGGSIFKHKGKYILFYSVGDYLLNNYKLGMAFSASLIPNQGQTYRTVKLPDLKRVWGESGHQDEIGYLLQSEKPQWPNYSANLVVGPGLGSIVTIDDKPWLFFHGYKPDDKERRPENRFVFRVPVTMALDRGVPSLKWLQLDLPDERILARQRQEERAKLVKAFGKSLKPNTVWEGTSDWGQGRSTKSELRCVKSVGAKSEWEFSFLEASIFNTPVPFRQRWTGELINNDKDGAMLRLTRHDGKAFHEYRLGDNGDMAGKDVNTAFTFRFTMKKDGK